MHRRTLCLVAAALAVAAGALPAAAAAGGHITRSAEIVNFDTAAPDQPGYPHGAQVVKLDEAGNAVDAHADYLAYFGDRYYLYGEYHGCTYNYQPDDFCGFRVYESKDLVHWKSPGTFIDPATSNYARETCQTTIGCWGQQVLYNETTGKYVLWFYRAIGTASNRVQVLEGDSPTGPWVDPSTPAALPTNCHCAFHIFKDKDGTAYISYTTGEFGLSVQKLNDSYTDGVGPTTTVTRPSGSIVSPHCQTPGGLTGPDFQFQTPAQLAAWKNCGIVEAPSILRKGDRYYMTFSDPICAFCLGTGTSYFVADDPLGPWTGRNGSPSFDPNNLGKFDAYPLSSDSCGGQPFNTAELPTASGKRVHLFASVLWANSREEGAANHYWEPLRFRNGLIEPLTCDPTAEVELARPVPDRPELPRALNICGAREGTSLTQTLKAPATGRLRSIELPLYQKTRPATVFGVEGLASTPLEVELRRGDDLVATRSFTAEQVSWTPTRVALELDVPVRAGERLALTLVSATPDGCYESLYEVHNPYPVGRLSGSGIAESYLTSRSDLLFTGSVETVKGVVEFGT